MHGEDEALLLLHAIYGLVQASRQCWIKYVESLGKLVLKVVILIHAYIQEGVKMVWCFLLSGLMIHCLLETTRQLRRLSKI